MKKKVLALILGIVVAAVFIFAMELAFAWVHPYPADIDFHDARQVEAHIDNMPLYAAAVVLFGWALASFAGGYVLARVGKSYNWRFTLILGLILTGISTMNLIQFHHPLWFSVCAVGIWIPFVFLGAH